MAEELIDSYIDRGSIKNDTDFFVEQIERVLAAFDKANATKIDLGGAKGVNETLDSLKRLNKELDETIKLNEESVKANLDAASAAAQNTKATRDNARASTENAKAKKEEEKASREKAKAEKEEEKAAKDRAKAEAQAAKDAARAKKEEEKAAKDKLKADREAAAEAARLQKIEEDLANEYLQLSKAYNDAALKAKNYALTLGDQHPVTVQAVADAKAMYDVLYKVDKSVGQYSRNVGNYASAFDGLSVSFTQVARELPSLAISPQTFLLAISNNLPQVQDEIRKAKVEIAGLKAEGKDAPSLFEKIASATLSWQVGLAIGITLLTTYGGKIIELVSNLLDGSSATREAAEAQRVLNEQLIKTRDLQNSYYTLINTGIGSRQRELENNLAYLRATGAGTKEVLAAELELQRERQKNATANFNLTGGANELEKLRIRLSDATDSYKEFIETRKAFGKILEPGSEDYKNREAQLKAELDLSKDLYSEQKTIVLEFYNANRDAEIKRLELLRANKEKAVELFTGEIEYRIQQLKEFAALDALSAETRKARLTDAYEYEKDLLDLRRADEVRKAEGDGAQIDIINRKYALEKLKIQDAFRLESAKIDGQYREQQLAIEKAITDDFTAEQAKRLDTEAAALQKRTNYLKEAEALELAALERRKPGLSDEDYQRQRLEITVKYQELILREEIAYTENVIALAKARGEDVSGSERKLAELKLALATETNKRLLDDSKKSQKEEEDLLKKREAMYKQLRGATVELFTSVITGSFERQKNAVQDQIDALEAQKQKEIEVANQTITNEQDKAARISVINARAAAERTALERKQRDLNVQKAKFERAAAVAKVIQETAVNVTEYFGTPLAFLAGVIGAVQIATILAQPIPRYRTGREGGPAELAIVGDGGVREVITDAAGNNPRLTPAKDTLVKLGAGDKVYSSVADYVKSRSAGAAIGELGGITATDDEVVKLLRQINDKQGQKSETNYSLKDGEFKKTVRRGNSWTTYLNKNVFE